MRQHTIFNSRASLPAKQNQVGSLCAVEETSLLRSSSGDGGACACVCVWWRRRWCVWWWGVAPWASPPLTPCLGALGDLWTAWCDTADSMIFHDGCDPEGAHAHTRTYSLTFCFVFALVEVLELVATDALSGRPQPSVLRVSHVGVCGRVCVCVCVLPLNLKTARVATRAKNKPCVRLQQVIRQPSHIRVFE